MKYIIAQKLLQLCFFVLILLTGCSQMTQPSAIPSASPTTTSVPPLPSATGIPPTATVTDSYPSTETVSLEDLAQFESENYPDNSIVQPGEEITKTWTIKNIGTSEWTTAYRLVLIDVSNGNPFGASESIPFSKDVMAGETIDFSVSLIAPVDEGLYTATWMIQNDRHEWVGGDENKLWVQLKVCQNPDTCQTGNSMGSNSNNGVTMSLNSFTSDAQSTTVSSCLSVSLQYYMFDQIPKLIVDNQEAAFIGGGSDFISGTGCTKLTYQINSTEIAQARSILFSLDTVIRTSPPPGDPNVACETAKQTLKITYPGIDFTCKFSMAGYYTDLLLPSGLTRESADQIIKDTIEGAIYGPWILTIR